MREGMPASTLRTTLGVRLSGAAARHRKLSFTPNGGDPSFPDMTWYSGLRATGPNRYITAAKVKQSRPGNCCGWTMDAAPFSRVLTATSNGDNGETACGERRQRRQGHTALTAKPPTANGDNGIFESANTSFPTQHGETDSPAKHPRIPEGSD